MREEHEGRDFFRRLQPRVSEVLKKCTLEAIYSHASATALHVRHASAVRGLSWKYEPAVEANLGFQEVDREHPFDYFVAVMGFLETQHSFFCSLSRAFPEVTSPFWPSAVRGFFADLVAMWGEMFRRFPEDSKRMDEIAKSREQPAE